MLIYVIKDVSRESMSIVDKRATSWANAIDLLYENSWQENLQRYRSNFVFRGLSDQIYDLKTSLTRLGGAFWELEGPLLRNFSKYSELGHADRLYSDWKWLTLAQQHGLPTRLLDWTYSPFVALHFATANIHHSDRDGVVWCADFVKVHDEIPDILKEQQMRAKSNAFTVGMLETVAKIIHDFDALADSPFAVFFEPPSMSDRIVNQFALFSVMSDPRISIDSWLNSRAGVCKRIIIPKEIKSEIRDKLDQANITERVLFPGLDGMATWLKRHYSSKENSKPPVP
jgi:hypothetical protein